MRATFPKFLWGICLFSPHTQPAKNFPQGGNPFPNWDPINCWLLEAWWRGDRLWTSANTGCGYQGGLPQRACAHLIEINTATGAVSQDIVLDQPGENYVYPAIGTDASGHLYLSVTHVNGATFPEARVAGRRPTDPTNSISDPPLLRRGERAYSLGFETRWGDYLSAAVDPRFPECVWLAGEYAKDLPGSRNWGTYIAATSYSGGCDSDNDGVIDASDTNDDNDMLIDTTEVACGSDPVISASLPERLDLPGDEDGDWSVITDDINENGEPDPGEPNVNEPLPSGSSGLDCDGDGWTGTEEMPIFAVPDTAKDQDPCGNSGWPAELSQNDNRLNIADFTSFILPLRPNDGHGTFNYFGHTVPDAGIAGAERWNLNAAGAGASAINIADLNALNPAVNAPTARPPMFGGQLAFFTNAGLCPGPPDPPMGAPAGGGGGSAPVGEDKPGTSPANDEGGASPSSGGEPSIDQISIDTGPPGPMRPLVTNGRPATGDRDGDTVADAEGYDTPDPGDAAGVCGNGLDDDRADTDGDTVPDGPLDGVADDGCQMPLTVRETCINIIDDGIKNADEDAVVAGQDRSMIDITVGLAAIGGIPASLPMSSWQYTLEWDVDVLDVRLQQSSFMILAAGGASPFTSVANAVPDAASPFTAAVSDSGPGETGPGVLSRVTVEGNAAGLANLTLTGVQVTDAQNAVIPVNAINGAMIAVSKDLDGDGVIESLGANGQESFSCPPP